MIKKTCFSRLFISILCILLMLEIGIRVMSTELSSNIKHISNIPNMSSTISGTSNDIGETILVMGNSLIGNAVIIDQFNKDMSRDSSKDVMTYKVAPDATTLLDWYCITKNNFTGSQKSPDTIVIGFAWDQLDDRQEIHPSRLAAFFCNVPDMLDLYQLGMSHSSDVLEYLVASVSRLYALRELIHKRILDLLIYNYRSNTQYTNASVRADSHSSINEITPLNNYLILLKYLELLSKNNIKPVFVAMPVIDNYILDSDAISLIEENGGVFYDLRYMDGITKDMFIDPIHLGTAGSVLFTMSLADIISTQYSEVLKTAQ